MGKLTRASSRREAARRAWTPDHIIAMAKAAETEPAQCEVCGPDATGDADGGVAETTVDTGAYVVAVCESCAESWAEMRAEADAD